MQSIGSDAGMVCPLYASEPRALYGQYTLPYDHPTFTLVRFDHIGIERCIVWTPTSSQRMIAPSAASRVHIIVLPGCKQPAVRNSAFKSSYVP